MDYTKITSLDYFRMPFFRENWLTFVLIFLCLFLVRRKFFKNDKFSILHYVLAIDLIIYFAMPLESYSSIKLWKWSDNMLLYVCFPIIAVLISTAVSYAVFKGVVLFRNRKKKSKRQT